MAGRPARPRAQCAPVYTRRAKRCGRAGAGARHGDRVEHPRFGRCARSAARSRSTASSRATQRRRALGADTEELLRRLLGTGAGARSRALRERAMAIWTSPTRRRRKRFAPSCAPGCATTCRASRCRATLEEEAAYLTAWQRRLSDAGWAAVHWPREYGGRGASLTEQAIFQEEMARARAPQMMNRVGINLVGPTLIAHGTEEQRRRYLPPHPELRGDLVPALLRAQRRLRPRLAAHPRRARRRRLPRRRAEGVDQLRAVRALGHPAGAHRCRGAAAPRHQLPASSTCAPRASPSGRCARSPAAPSSARRSSTTSRSRART